MLKTLEFALIGLALMQAPVAAQDPAMLVDVDWLTKHVKDANVVLLHVGQKPGYDAEHIPGARFVTLDDISLPHDHNDPKQLILELPPAEALRAKLATAYGISDNSRIVVYFGKDWITQSTRVVFTLDYLGLGDQTFLLNGGMPAWKKAGQAVTAELPSITPGKLTARPTKSLVVDAEFVKNIAQRPNHRLVDARAAVFYNGIEPTYEKAGHIPGAINIPFTTLGDENLIFKREHLSELFRTAGIKTGDTVVAYCHIGQQATAVVFAARLLGHPVLFYDGAFQDWASNNRGPVER
jgi:thiosulfate/3-mercaptopyruvate sulfurtransferase